MGGTDMLVAIMFGIDFTNLSAWITLDGKMMDLSLSQPKESPGPDHLVHSIYCQSIVIYRPSQHISPGVECIVTIGTGIQGNISIIPPQIQMQLVGMGWPSSDNGRLADRPFVWIL